MTETTAATPRPRRAARPKAGQQKPIEEQAAPVTPPAEAEAAETATAPAQPEAAAASEVAAAAVARVTGSDTMVPMTESESIAAQFPHRRRCPANPARVESWEAIVVRRTPEGDPVRRTITLARCCDCGEHVEFDPEEEA